jgi:dienelactone hydrolase
MAVSDDASLRGGEFVGKQFPLEVGLRVHPNPNGTIVISYPGLDADIDGYANKYGNLGDFLQARVGAVLRTNNPHYAGFEYQNSVQEHLRAVVDYALQHSQEISGTEPEETSLYLMGYSAGGSGVAAVAHEYAQVEKILLMAPSGDAGETAVAQGLGQYTGECNIVVGEDDELVGVEAGKSFASLATAASVVREVVIPDCDHQFRGETNGRIMSAAPLWAFQGVGGERPLPEDGITLYT